MGTLLVKCGWCGIDLGTKPCDDANDGKVTHGICDACAIAIRKPRAHTVADGKWIFCCDPTCGLCEDHIPEAPAKKGE
jgi:hypothetical protein